MTARSVWDQGDYAVIARRLRPAAAALVRLCSIGPGDRVLDIAAGTGNVAIAAARVGASVTALDSASRLVDVGRARSAVAGASIDWRVADMEVIDAPDGAFDATLSAFGLIYSANPERAIDEAFRVTAGDGCVGLAMWPHGSFQHEAQAALASVLATEVVVSPWADSSEVRGLLGRHAGTVVVDETTFEWCFPSVEQWIAEAERTAPPLVALLETLQPPQRNAVRVALTDVARRFTASAGDGITIVQQALLAVGWKR